MLSRKHFFIVVAILTIIQFIRPYKNDRNYINNDDFLLAENVPKPIAKIIVKSCYDCHSNKTNYKWFDNISPISWYVDSNIEKGKNALNFSEWKTFEPWKRRLSFNAIMFNITTDKMPPKMYSNLHSEVELNKEQELEILNWIKTLDFSKY